MYMFLCTNALRQVQITLPVGKTSKILSFYTYVCTLVHLYTCKIKFVKVIKLKLIIIRNVNCKP